MIFDNLCSQGWKLSWFSFSQGQKCLWNVDAARDGQRYIVRAEKLSDAFSELKRICAAC
jgi:hypothetical protein